MKLCAKRGKIKTLTFDVAAEFLSYDTETGDFYWLRAAGNRMVGTKAYGWISDAGYRVIRINKAAHMAHRLAWLLTYGAMPLKQIDHIDGDKLNNRISNLRLATASQNQANMPRRRNNTSGSKSVRRAHWNETKWVAHIKNTHIGTFSSREEAVQAYEKAAKREFGNFGRAD
jgi:hypothetical protein